jgi:hypothetical protein
MFFTVEYVKGEIAPMPDLAARTIIKNLTVINTEPSTASFGCWEFYPLNRQSTC